MAISQVVRSMGKTFVVLVSIAVFLVLPAFGVWRAAGKIYDEVSSGSQSKPKETHVPKESSPETKDTEMENVKETNNTTEQGDTSSSENGSSKVIKVNPGEPNPLHKNITATMFWVGEEADKDNKGISNAPSAWDDEWLKHFGGIDDPENRDGFFPDDFTPDENPFYLALPYNDFDRDGKRRDNVEEVIPWAGDRTWKKKESMVKNHWVKITKGDTTAYGQWEDVGPFKENDFAYVFGSSEPKSDTNDHAGIDLSPALNKYLDLHDVDTVDWQFVDEKDVPPGPWKKIVTKSQINWD